MTNEHIKNLNYTFWLNYSGLVSISASFDFIDIEPQTTERTKVNVKVKVMKFNFGILNRSYTYDLRVYDKCK